MPFDKTLGLLRLADSGQQLAIESDLGMAFEDLYDAVDTVRDNARHVEHFLTDLLYGVRSDERPERRLLAR